MKIQLPFNFQFRETLSFDNFLASNNSELVKALKSMSLADESQSLFIWGPYGSGRSHLCQALYQQAEDDNTKVAYLALSEEGIEPAILNQLESFSLVILDDLDAVLKVQESDQLEGNKLPWDEALFHLYNRIRDSGGNLLMTSSNAPASLEHILPDLKSRLGWGLVYQLDELSDADKVQALIHRANERGLKLTVETAQYLLNRLPRDTHQLFEILEKLDHQSLAQKRSLTVPFIKSVLKL